MNKYHISYTITVEAETYSEAYELADDIYHFIEDAAPEELSIVCIDQWGFECDMDNEDEE